MNSIIKVMILSVLFGPMGCEENNNLKLYLNDIDRTEYYDEEILPVKYQHIYGKWKLAEISGGISGTGRALDFDFLEMKSIGIYGLIRNGILFEYGKIELHTFDVNQPDILQVKLVPVFYSGSNPYMSLQEKYVELMGTDTLDLVSPCCDMYNYRFNKIFLRW
ncbi:MAG: hypothetical protein OEV74_06090 [Cyclobacteriaceae bacterium]|nr:hypothetical protein [Cyclobacteriaceae bacterium]MDH4295829.1 hypothetical protein [Cyclobacteriaceae bacterium]MDH5247674.1 hypothetical protein [Cyclobacteriaceae bacterium]